MAKRYFDDRIYATIGGLQLFGVDEAGAAWHVERIGNMFASAASTLTTQQRTWGHGLYSSTPFYGGRDFIISGVIRANSTADVIYAYERLKQAVGLDPVELLVDFRTVKRLTTVQLLDAFGDLQWMGERSAKFVVQLLSKVSYMLDGSTVTTGETGLPAASGGFTFPNVFSAEPVEGYHLWVFDGTVLSGSISLINAGNSPAPVVLRVDGQIANPRIEHVQTGRVLELNQTIGAGHYVIFDSRTKQILIDGTDPARGAIVRREWSDALHGNNTWAFSALGGSPTAKLTITFRSAWI